MSRDPEPPCYKCGGPSDDRYIMGTTYLCRACSDVFIEEFQAACDKLPPYTQPEFKQPKPTLRQRIWSWVQRLLPKAGE